MLILPNGYGEFNEKIRMWEPKDGDSSTYHDKKTYQETGFKVNAKVPDKRDDLQGFRVRWQIPENFCPQCGRTSIPDEELNLGSEGLFGWGFARPELRMKPIDRVRYFRCGTCFNNEVFGDQCRLWYPNGSKQWRDLSCAQQIGQTIEEWIKAQILSGNDPIGELDES